MVQEALVINLTSSIKEKATLIRVAFLIHYIIYNIIASYIQKLNLEMWSQ